MAEWEHVVAEQDHGLRLDVLLARRAPDVSRARARRLVDEDKVRVNGRRRKRGEQVSAGDRIELLELPGAVDFDATPDPELPLAVVLELPELVVVDKPAGVPSHPLRPDERRTLAGALVARYPEMRGVGYSPREPGILHRLDSGTSGLMLAARDAATFDALRTLQKQGEIAKRYRALCSGRVNAPSKIAVSLAGDPRDRRRVIVNEDGTQVYETSVFSSEPVGDHSLVEVGFHTGFRHQIRVHMAWTGHPLVGDTLYRGTYVEGLSRQFLHASGMSFHRPATEDVLTLESELPDDLQRVLGALTP